MEVTRKIVVPDPETGFINVILDGTRYSINAGNADFPSALEAFKNEDWDNFISIVNPTIKLSQLYASYEGIEVKDGNLYVCGEPVHSALTSRVLEFLRAGADCVHLFKFILKLNLNPSSRAVNELYTFLQHKSLPITDNGNFLAYKAVRPDFTDVHTGKFINTVDSVLEMPRNKVDDDKEVGCSYGFHAGTIQYAKGFMPSGGHVMLVEINPADVVSIPTDCECQKLRTCKYKVVDEYEFDLDDPYYASRYPTEHDDQVDLWDDEEEEFLCSGCNSEYNSWCMDCEQCGDCCECSDDDESEDEPKTEIQLTLNLDNKIQIPWYQIKVKLDTLLNHLFKSRRPAIAMAIRRDNKEYDLIEIVYGCLLNYTTRDDAYSIYKEMNS